MDKMDASKEKPEFEDKTVVPLRKGVLAPKRKRGVSIGFGIEDEDLVFRDPDGSIERTKLIDGD